MGRTELAPQSVLLFNLCPYRRLSSDRQDRCALAHEVGHFANAQDGTRTITVDTKLYRLGEAGFDSPRGNHFRSKRKKKLSFRSPT